MSVGVKDQRQSFSRDAALIAIAQARDQIGVPDDRPRPDRPAGPELRSEMGSKTSGAVEARQSMLEAPVKPLQGTARGGFPMRVLFGLGALVPIGVIVLAWHFLYRQVDEAPVSTSSVSEDFVAKSAAPSTSPRAGQHSATAVPSAESPPLDLAQSVATTAHQLAVSEQEIDELKTRQAQILLDNSELDRRLKEAQELARNNADLINDLKSAQSRMAQDNNDLAAQLKASQEQMTNLAAQLDASQTQVAKIAAQIKVSQDQIARLLEQRQRAKLLSSGSPPAGIPTKKPAPKPRLQQAKPQTENPAQTQ